MNKLSHSTAPVPYLSMIRKHVAVTQCNFILYQSMILFL